VPGLASPITRATMLGDRIEGRELTIDDGGTWQAIDLSGLHPLEHATVIRCEFDGELVIDESIPADNDGNLRLSAESAQLSGPNIRIEHLPGSEGSSVPNIGYWTEPTATVSWTVRAAPGKYRVLIDHAVRSGHEGGTLNLIVGDRTFPITFAESTGDTWGNFFLKDAGVVELAQGEDTIDITLRPVAFPGEALVNIRSTTLIPMK